MANSGNAARAKYSTHTPGVCGLFLFASWCAHHAAVHAPNADSFFFRLRGFPTSALNGSADAASNPRPEASRFSSR